MSAEARNSVSPVWAGLEGHLVNGVFPLHRCIGSSPRSGVFLTESAKRTPSELAIKLVPVISTPSEVQLLLWLTAADLAHPHLLRIFEAGRCEIDGLHYLYAAMEYADQTLAQLLADRALTEDEVREMLVPTLGALSFLHEKNFVQGHLKPSNVLVVGDQLKLAGDMNRLVDDVGESVSSLSVYHPPEGRDGKCSTEGDIWGLGVTVCEALTRRQPSGLRSSDDAAVLPPELPKAFHDFVTRCLSRSPHDRPKVVDLERWLRGRPLPAVPVAIPESAAMALLETPVPSPVVAPVVAARTVAPATAAPTPVAAAPKRVEREPHIEPPRRPRVLPLLVGAFVAFVLVWAGLRAIRPASTPVPSPAPTVRVEPIAEERAPEIPDQPAPAAVLSQPAVAPPPPARTTGSASEIHEVIPDVPRRASQTIRGIVRVSVRVIVEKDGTVFAALTEVPGPSRYFERLAIDAAKQWTFPPADTDAQRLWLVRFAFSREGTTASVVPLR